MTTIAAGWAAFTAGDFPQVEAIFDALLANPAHAGEGHHLARFGLGYVWAYTGRYGEARSVYETLEQEALAQGDAWAAHRARHQVGMVERLAGNWRAARACFEVERRMLEALGSPDLPVSVNAYELGLVAMHLGEQDQAKAWLEVCLETAARTPDRVALGCAHRILGDWHDMEGDATAATVQWRAAGAAFLDAGHLHAVTDLQGRLNRTQSS